MVFYVLEPAKNGFILNAWACYTKNSTVHPKLILNFGSAKTEKKTIVQIKISLATHPLTLLGISYQPQTNMEDSHSKIHNIQDLNDLKYL